MTTKQSTQERIDALVAKYKAAIITRIDELLTELNVPITKKTRAKVSEAFFLHKPTEEQRYCGMTLNEYREHLKLTMRKWRAKNRAAYRKYQREYQRQYQA